MDKLLWNKDVEITFFEESRNFATPEQLFYVTDDKKYLSYWPKGYNGIKSTLQSRNSLIGAFTEKWTTDLLDKIVRDKGLCAVKGAICDEIGLTNRSPADVVISEKNEIELEPEDIKLIIEVKMSIVWNWELKSNGKEKLISIGDYTTHQGNPSLLRSDSMLKAIGKSINIRVSSLKASNIPIIVMGNSPITNSYYSKVDHLKKAGIVQGFWSVNPDPINGLELLKTTKDQGFYKFDTFNELKNSVDKLLNEDLNFFSSMRTKNELGRIIEISNKEKTYEEKAELFLKLLRE